MRAKTRYVLTFDRFRLISMCFNSSTLVSTHFDALVPTNSLAPAILSCLPILSRPVLLCSLSRACSLAPTVLLCSISRACSLVLPLPRLSPVSRAPCLARLSCLVSCPVSHVPSLAGEGPFSRATPTRQKYFATGIDSRALVTFRPGMGGAREKLQWVSKRVTAVPEDVAYLLFGIFGVHLPVIYGEKKQNALSRVTSLPWTGLANHPSSIVVCQPKSLHIKHQHPCYHLFLKMRFKHRSPHYMLRLCSQLRNFIPCFTT